MKEEILKLMHKGSPGASAWDAIAERPILESVIPEIRRSNVNVMVAIRIWNAAGMALWST